MAKLLSELSQATLLSYARKASKDASSKTIAGDKAKGTQRWKNADLARDKAANLKKVGPSEVNEEGSDFQKPSKGQDPAKFHTAMVKHFSTRLKQGAKNPVIGSPLADAYVKNAASRSRLKTNLDHHKSELQKLGEDTLNELSMKTIGSYIKKAQTSDLKAFKKGDEKTMNKRWKGMTMVLKKVQDK